MIQNKSENTMITNGQGNQMSVILNEKAYATLSDTLYSNKERSTAREYITNAWDSHIDAGKEDVAFQVHCPTDLEPWFSVRDFGTGLDKDQVESIFATYFLSTKEDTNDTNGCYGLGSKSAFSVSNTFTVTSIKNGIKTTHSFYKDSNGFPTSRLMFESKTGESNGVEVKVPVSSKSLRKWQREISRLICCFPKVDCNIDKDSTYEKMLSDLEKEKYGVVDLDPYQSKQEILMGNVLYPLEDISKFVKNKRLREKVSKSLKDSHIILKAGLGELNIPPSRESISMDEYTVRKLTKIVNKFIIEYIRGIEEQLEDINWSSYYSVRNTLKGTPLWEHLSPHIYFSGARLYYLEHTWENSHGRKVEIIPFDFRIRGYRKGIMGYWGYYANCQRDCAVLVKDVLNPKIFYGDIKNVIETFNKAFNDHHTTIYHVDNKDNAEKLAKWFGVEIEGDISKYVPVKEKKVRTERDKHGSLEDRYCLARYVADNKEHNQDKIDLEDVGVCYVEDTSITDSVPFKWMYKWTSQYFMELLESLGYTKIILMNKINERKILKAGIPCGTELVNQYYKSNKKDYTRKEARECFYINLNNTVLSKYLNPLCRSYKKFNSLKDTSQLEYRLKSSELERSRFYDKEKQKMQSLAEDYQKEYDSLMEKYPLVRRLYDSEDIEYYLKLEKAIK